VSPNVTAIVDAAAKLVDAQRPQHHRDLCGCVECTVLAETSKAIRADLPAILDTILSPAPECEAESVATVGSCSECDGRRAVWDRGAHEDMGIEGGMVRACSTCGDGNNRQFAKTAVDAARVIETFRQQARPVVEALSAPVAEAVRRDVEAALRRIADASDCSHCTDEKPCDSTRCTESIARLALARLVAHLGTRDTGNGEATPPDAWCDTCDREPGSAAIRHDGTHAACGMPVRYPAEEAATVPAPDLADLRAQLAAAHERAERAEQQRDEAQALGAQMLDAANRMRLDRDAALSALALAHETVDKLTDKLATERAAHEATRAGGDAEEAERLRERLAAGSKPIAAPLEWMHWSNVAVPIDMAVRDKWAAELGAGRTMLCASYIMSGDSAVIYWENGSDHVEAWDVCVRRIARAALVDVAALARAKVTPPNNKSAPTGEE
jgi:hypothetical protein